eukprot:m.113215 g.113215  ORF g.113215 m.113215 type:complete len:1574 (-) comp10796_c0_seq1:73-4794(-)
MDRGGAATRCSSPGDGHTPMAMRRHRGAWLMGISVLLLSTPVLPSANATACTPPSVDDLVLVTLSTQVTEFVTSFTQYLTISPCVSVGPYSRFVTRVETYNASVHGIGANFVFADCPLGCVDAGTFAVPSTLDQGNRTSSSDTFDVACGTSNCIATAGACFAVPECYAVLGQAMTTGVLPVAFNPDNPTVFGPGSPIVECIDTACNTTLMDTARTRSNTSVEEGVPTAQYEVRHVNLVSAGLTRLDPSTFSGLHDLREISLLRNSLRELPVQIFANNTRLQFVYLSGNHLTAIYDGTFASQTDLRQLWMHSNRLTMLGDNVFSTLQRLETLVLSNNQLVEVPRAVQGLTTLRELWLNQNRLTHIAVGDFSGLVSLHFLALGHNNALTSVAPTAFTTLSSLDVNLDNYSTRSILGVGFEIRAVDPTTPYALGLPSGLPPFTINPAPVDCQWTGPNVSSVNCSLCTFGYTLSNAPGGSTVCVLPSFQPWSGWDASPLQNEMPEVVHLRESIRLSAPDLVPRKDKFVGYAQSNYMAIRYEIDFPSSVTLGCDVPVTGDTSTQDAHHLNGTAFDRVHRTLQYGYDDRPKDLRFQVVSPGWFTFDSCDSLYTTSLSLFRVDERNMDPDVEPHLYGYEDMVEPDIIPDSAYTFLRLNFPQAEEWSNMSRSQMVWTAGCELSASARRTVYLDIGLYDLRVRGNPFQNDTGGVYLVQMECHGNATTLSTQRDPGGFSVEAETGAVSGSPQTVGSSYRMRLSAVDRQGARAPIVEWNFNVSERLFDTVDGWVTTGYDASRNILPRYHVDEFHEIHPPTISQTSLFVHPSLGDYDSIVYLLVANRTDDIDAPASAQVPCTPAARSQLFTDVVSGEGALKIPCTGRYNAVLKARDVSGFETVVNMWDFEVRRADTDVPAYGPNGSPCAHGTAVDNIPMDASFTCDCSLTFYTGSNCAVRASATTSTSSSDNRGWIAAVVVVVTVSVLAAVAVLVVAIRTRRAKQQPQDFADILQQLRAAGLLPPDTNVSPGAPTVPIELPRRSITVAESIGTGNFGEVRRGVLTQKVAGPSGSGPIYTQVDVAVKVLLQQTGDASRDFMRESALTWQFNHPNLVKMFGVVTTGAPHMLILELCHNGELRNYLIRHGNALDNSLRIGFLRDIANGMSHLSSRGFVHRDLASRNVLLNAELVAKVCDFGLGRELEDADYYRSTAESIVLPLRWTDPAVFETNRFSEYTDVWSFGVLAIEVFTNGETPYRGWTNMFIVEQLKEGYRLPQPPLCPTPVYNTIIRPCWDEINENRPSFDDLCGLLGTRAEYGTATQAPTTCTILGHEGHDGKREGIPSIVVDDPADNESTWVAATKHASLHPLTRGLLSTSMHDGDVNKDVTATDHRDHGAVHRSSPSSRASSLYGGGTPHPNHDGLEHDYEYLTSAQRDRSVSRTSSSMLVSTGEGDDALSQVSGSSSRVVHLYGPSSAAAISPTVSVSVIEGEHDDPFAGVPRLGMDTTSGSALPPPDLLTRPRDRSWTQTSGTSLSMSDRRSLYGPSPTPKPVAPTVANGGGSEGGVDVNATPLRHDVILLHESSL